MVTWPAAKRSPTRGAHDDAPARPMAVACPPTRNAPGGHSGPESEHFDDLSTLAPPTPTPASASHVPAKTAKTAKLF
jgi:hypothetical protein